MKFRLFEEFYLEEYKAKEMPKPPVRLKLDSHKLKKIIDFFLLKHQFKTKHKTAVGAYLRGCSLKLYHCKATQGLSATSLIILIRGQVTKETPKRANHTNGNHRALTQRVFGDSNAETHNSWSRRESLRLRRGVHPRRLTMVQNYEVRLAKSPSVVEQCDDNIYTVTHNTWPTCSGS
ncbi:hypothetical protein TNCV_4695351 [Trichonephila clavipes]|nr:hypothetical protein TNCV_4695351 [Trichonephila clavipes]